MKEVVKRISLDLSRRTNKRYFYGNRNEYNSRIFIIKLYDDGVPYVVNKDVIACVNVLRADGKSWSYITDVTSDGCVYFVSTLWCFEAPGETQYTVTLIDSEMRITSSPFFIDVADDLAGPEHTNEVAENVTLFQQAMEYFASTKEMETERQENEKSRQSAENSRDAAEAQRFRNETDREYRENVRCQNEYERAAVTETMLEALDNLITLQGIYIDRGGLA